MGQKRQAVRPKFQSPPPSSSEDEGEEEEEEEEDDEDAATPLPSQPSPRKSISNKAAPLSNPTRNPPDNSSSEEEEDDDDEEEDSEVEKAKYIAAESRLAHPPQDREEEHGQGSEPGFGSQSEKQISSHPIGGGLRSKKTTSKPNNVSAVHKQMEKPKSSDNGSKNRKNLAAAFDGKGLETGSKKSSFRTQVQEDAITILKGMIEFKERDATDAWSDLIGFHQFMNSKPLNSTLNRQKLSRKIQELKRKYRKWSDELKAGNDASISKPPNKLIYRLSKKVWDQKDSALEDEDTLELEESGVGVDTPKEKENPDSKGISIAEEKEKGGGNAKRVLAAEEKGEGDGKKKRRDVDKESPKSIPSSDFLSANSQRHNVENPEKAKNGDTIYPFLCEFLRSSGFFGDGLEWLEGVVKRAFELMGPSQAKDLNERWIELQWKEREIHMERLSFAYELVKKSFELAKSSS